MRSQVARVLVCARRESSGAAESLGGVWVTRKLVRLLSGCLRSWRSRAGGGRPLSASRRRFPSDQSGAVLAETIIVVPVIIAFMIGILEFSAFLWTKIQVENGLKDAARYMARCQPELDPVDTSFLPDSNCETTAKRIAVGGFADAKAARSGNWNESDIAINLYKRSTGSVTTYVIAASTSFEYPGAMFLGALSLGEVSSITLSALHEERVMRVKPS